MTELKPRSISRILIAAVFWLYVLIPLSWGVWSTLQKALVLFG